MDYRLHDLLKVEIDGMTRRERRQFKAVLTQTLPSYITGAARVARTAAAQKDTNERKNQAQAD
jgi:hypothetical protein